MTRNAKAQSRREFLRTSVLGGGLSALYAGCATTGTAPNRLPVRKHPNVIVILADDLGQRDCGCYGSSFYETPHLDRLAQRSVQFSDAYAASPVCSPTRAAFMSGKTPSRLGITDWIPGENRTERLHAVPNATALAHQEFTIAEAFQTAGYATCHIGKWHLGETESHYPESQGFDVNIAGNRKGSPAGGYFHPFTIEHLPPTQPGDHLPAVLTDHALAFIEEQQHDPFFLYLSFYSVHSPVQGRPDLVEKYKRKLKGLAPSDTPEFLPEGDGARNKEVQNDPEFAAMVEAMDEQIGRVLAQLETLGLADDTIVVFTSDNGGQSTLENDRRPPWGSNRPLRAGKGWLYEGGIRVPLLIHDPRLADRPAVCAAPTVTMDLYPTLLELAGLPLRPEQHLDGASLASCLKDPAAAPPHESLCWHYPHYHGSGHRPASAIREGDWKLIEFYETASVELYNLRADIRERYDISGRFHKVARDLHAKLDRWRKETGAAIPEQNTAFERK